MVNVTLDPRILNLMQFARKAGKLEAGIEACIRALHRNHIHLMIIADDTAERTEKRVRETLKEFDDIPLIKGGEKLSISQALGLPETTVYGICDPNFASRMLQLSRE